MGTPSSQDMDFHRWVGKTLINKDGPVADDCLEGRQIVVMFFASNGAETAGAVTQISTLYNAIQQTPQKDEFEIVFVSNDADQASFDQAFANQPWIAIPFSEAEKRADLTKAHEVEGIGFQVLAKDCTMIPLEGDAAFNPNGGVALLNLWKKLGKPGNWMARAIPQGGGG